MSNDSIMKTCPYISSHKIHPSKFQAHIFKCAKSHPEIAKQMEVCPFNALHRMFGSEMDKHLLECPDNQYILESAQNLTD
jgi:hypothetical protein